MENKIVLDGISFVASGRDYFYNAQRRMYLHRYLWEKAFGKIPEGYEIHHKDWNKRNNDLDNLEMLTVSEHRERHNNEMTDERRQQLRENMLKNALPAAIEWHGSEQGIEWHKEHYERYKHKFHTTVDKRCIQCDTPFTAGSNGRNKFCSNKCKSAYRVSTGVDDEVRICANCGTSFTKNKYSKTKNCSRSCAMKSRLKDSPNLHE